MATHDTLIGKILNGNQQLLPQCHEHVLITWISTCTLHVHTYTDTYETYRIFLSNRPGVYFFAGSPGEAFILERFYFRPGVYFFARISWHRYRSFPSISPGLIHEKSNFCLVVYAPPIIPGAYPWKMRRYA